MTDRIPFANSLRGIAAVVVVFAHHFGVFWLGPWYVEHQTGMPALGDDRTIPAYVWVVTLVPNLNWGLFGVALFFLVSGFVIPFSFDKTRGLPFFIGRFFRLTPTYAAGFLLTLLALQIGQWHFGVERPYQTNHILVHMIPGLRDIAWTPVIDPIVWTLEVEVKFYLICAAMGGLFARRSKLVFIAPVALFLYGLAFPGVSEVLKPIGGYSYTLPLIVDKAAPYLIFMFIGVAYNYSIRNALRPQEFMMVVAFLFGILIFLWQKDVPAASANQIWSYGWAVGVFALAAAIPERFTDNRMLNYFAAISYPLYVVHCLIGYVVLRLLFDMGWPVLVNQVTAFVLVIALAHILHRVVEKPSHDFARQVMARMSTARAFAVPPGQELQKPVIQADPRADAA